MFDKTPITPPLNRGPNHSTAFTSLVVGVFLNSPLISVENLRGLNESEIYSKYGDSFLISLQRYSELNTLEQIQILHLLQRYAHSEIHLL